MKGIEAAEYGWVGEAKSSLRDCSSIRGLHGGEVGPPCHLAEIGMTIIKTGVVSEGVSDAEFDTERAGGEGLEGLQFVCGALWL